MRRLICLFVLCSSIVASAQETLLDKATAALNASDFSTASSLFRQVIATDPQNGSAWQGLGLASLKAGDLAEAEKGFEKAIDLRWHVPLNRLNLARVAAKRGDNAKALQIMEDLIAAGTAAPLRPYLSVPEFSGLQNLPKFQEIKQGFLPCNKPENRQFDFWAGEWDVLNPSGQQVGTSSVTVEQDGCVLVEHWKQGLGFETGTSFNYYDTGAKKWHQLYISNSGPHPLMSGTFTGGKMVLLTDPMDGAQSRWTWYELSPGKVRQMCELTTDAGKTWSVAWDSTYVKKPSQVTSPTVPR